MSFGDEVAKIGITAAAVQGLMSMGEQEGVNQISSLVPNLKASDIDELLDQLYAKATTIDPGRDKAEVFYRHAEAVAKNNGWSRWR